MILAILSLPIAVVSIEAVASLVSADMRQTRDAFVQAQVEQILLAACLADRKGESIQMPPSLATVGARVNIEHEKNAGQISIQLDHISRSFSLSAETIMP
jgi:hypothetical protein